jgi:hypothetical protein
VRFGEFALVIRQLKRAVGFLAAFAALVPVAQAQQVYLDRLPISVLAVTPPAERVSGEPGKMRVVETSCRQGSLSGARQRIVDIAVQEWAYFGFSVADETVERDRDSLDTFSGRTRRFGRGFSWLGVEESARLADSIAGYWAITGDGSWILNRQNERWEGSGIGARWRDPWSAAFISWVMCESGLGDDSRFDRAIAHHTYIDQAIRARDLGIDETAYIAYDVGEAAIEPGDLLCAARRPSYDSLDQRRGQLGSGIRSHCDIVVKIEPQNERVLAIGGNVRGSVSLKLLPARFAETDAATPRVTRVGRGGREIFAHLKLRSEPVAGDAFRQTPTLRMLGEQPDLVDQIRATLERAVRALSASVLL